MTLQVERTMLEREDFKRFEQQYADWLTNHDLIVYTNFRVPLNQRHPLRKAVEIELPNILKFYARADVKLSRERSVKKRDITHLYLVVGRSDYQREHVDAYKVENLGAGAEIKREIYISVNLAVDKAKERRRAKHAGEWYKFI